MTTRTDENWDSYVCRVEDKPASILVDLGLVKVAPLPDFPLLGHLGLSLQRTDENGFPDPQEYEELGKTEEALTAALVEKGMGLYAGRCIRAGETDFYFYLRQKANFGDIVERIMAIFTHPDWESGITNDPDWEVYLDFLFPGRFEMLGIQNRRAMTRLQEMGDQPSLTRLIEHWLDFDVETDLLTVADLALEQGFAVVRTESLALRLVRPDTLEQIDEIVFSLARLAFAHGGNYLGWACPATPA